MNDDSKKETAHLPPLPENVSYIKTLCPLCDGSIEFPADALGQQTDCPHCHKTFVLGSVTAPAQTEKVPSTLNQPPPALNQMNVNQKILTGVALVAFFISVCIAPWEVTSIASSALYSGRTEVHASNAILGKTTVYSPVWEQPSKDPNVYAGERYECRLLLSPLLGVWITIGVVFTGLFFLLKNTPSILKLIKAFWEWRRYG
jgi:hypothetical protein